MSFRSRLILAACLGAATFTASGALAEDKESGGSVDATYVVPYGTAKTLFQNLMVSQGKGEESIDFPELGISVFNREFTEAETEELRSNGYEAAPAFEVSLFDKDRCRDPSPIVEDVGRDVPPGVCRLVGPPTPIPASPPTVWIVDSGVDSTTAAKFLNVAKKIECTKNTTQCVDSAAADVTDNLGHGTMVAGIIGGKTVPGSAANKFSGYAGVSPNAPLNIVKVFDEEGSTNVWKSPLLGLRYVLSNAQAGDIVNISWGSAWLETSRRAGLNAVDIIDGILHQMADRQIRVVVAAGNADRGEDAQWVQSYAPANSATFASTVIDSGSSTLPAGAIYSVSAVETKHVGGTSWDDTPWPKSAFGASYAEPGVRIRSLWLADDSNPPKPQQNVCTGTSFAAPALAGLLVRAPKPPNPASPTGPDQVGFATPGTATDPNKKHPKCS
jgi:hypothetical protein